MEVVEAAKRFINEHKTAAAIISAGAIGLAGAGIGIEIDKKIEQPNGAVASGTVECASGRSVVGVWIKTQDGSGWAYWTSNPQQRSVASFNRDLPHQEIFSAHVGCGGTQRNWASDNYSSEVNTEQLPPNFLCYDTRAAATTHHRLGTCAIIHA